MLGDDGTEERITEEVSGLRVDFTNEITKTRTELNAKIEKSKTDTIK